MECVNLQHFVFSLANQLYPLLGSRGQLYEVELTMAEGVSGQAGDSRWQSKERPTASCFPFFALLICVFLIVCLLGRAKSRHVN